MKKYIIYTTNKASVDAQFNAIEGSDKYQKKGFMKDFKIVEKGIHRIAVFTAFDGCYEQFCNGLTDVEFLGKAENGKNHTDRVNPSKHFSGDDIAKIALAGAENLFN